MKKVFWISILVFFIDLVTKQLVVHFLDEGQSILLIPKFFSFTYAKNTGVAFSLLEGNITFIILMTVVIIGVIVSCLKEVTKRWMDIVGYGLVLGGAFGNLFDRVVYGYVIDFLDFSILGYQFPIFNLADSGIVIGVILLCVVGVLESRGKNENFGRKKDEN